MSNFLKENWFKLGVLLVLFCIGSAVFYNFLFYVPRRDELKRNEETFKEMKVLEAKKEQDKKEYIAQRRKDCFDIYNKEKDNWNNTTGSEYDEDDDKCFVLYKSQQGEWANTTCKDLLPGKDIDVGSYLWKISLRDYGDCSSKQFRKAF